MANMDNKTRDLVMGKLYLKNKDYKMAEKSFLNYLNINPEDYQALKMLAQVYENLNNHQKAFEFYERSYLVDTQRKGTLLDISRLLLVENSGLDHVDRKKWLKLAVQAFPTNPIVTSLRDTLPAIDSNPTPNKMNLESELMSKMDRLEERLASIEHLLSRLAVTREEPKQVQLEVSKQADLAKLDEPKQVHLAKEDKVKEAPTPPANPLPAADLVPISKPAPVANPFSALNLSSVASPQLATNPPPVAGLFSTLNFSSVANPFPAVKPVPVESPTPTTNSKSVTSSPPVANPQPAVSPLAAAPKPIFKPLTGGFTFGAGSGGSNLFADGLKKFNLPTEGSWTTTTPTKPFSFNADQTNEATETNNQEGGGDDEGDETVDAPELPIENTCDMQPIEIKSGEEDEDVVFEHRCKLFRFRDKEYKERGLGNIKVLKHRSTNAGRLIMRRDLINLVCLNCWSCSKIERVRDTQVRFAGLDASDGEPVMTVFLAKFKTQELTDTFISHLNELFHEESE